MIRGFLGILLLTCVPVAGAGETPFRVGVFAIDASPPLGSPLAYNPTKEVTTPLTCKGVVLLGAEAPIVLCAIDWIGIGNEGHAAFREELAKAAGTERDRVAVHTLHQHDAPWCDFSADALVRQENSERELFDSTFARDVIRRAAIAVHQAKENATPVTHVGLGEGIVEKVASNRRILGPDGKVLHVRFTATTDPVIRDFPEGVIDPKLKSIGFWNNDLLVVVLTYYATHPQSYYRTGQANPDFPGMARDERERVTGVPHVHFNGAGGNIGAGKYNDGAHEKRQVLADRVAAGMAMAWNRTQKLPISAQDVAWRSEAVALPVSPFLNETSLVAEVENKSLPTRRRLEQAVKLVWLRRCLAGEKIDIGCLSLGKARVLHLPGELFVEYQLEAQRTREDLFVAMAAYGDYGPWYIGTEISYGQGGYETGPDASLVAPSVEGVLSGAIRKLLVESP